MMTSARISILHSSPPFLKFNVTLNFLLADSSNILNGMFASITIQFNKLGVEEEYILT